MTFGEFNKENLFRRCQEGVGYPEGQLLFWYFFVNERENENENKT